MISWIVGTGYVKKKRESTKEKVYFAALRLRGGFTGTRIMRRQMKTATMAEKYAERLKNKWERIYCDENDANGRHSDDQRDHIQTDQPQAAA